jgi:hypothetical protein
MSLFTLSATKHFMKTVNPQNSHYCKYTVEIKELAHCENPRNYTIEFVNSYFHLSKRGYYHDRVDVDALAAGTADVDEEPVTLYLGYD